MTATKIEWATHTVNLVAGCEKVSPGCNNCYAERMAWRLAHNPMLPEGTASAYLSGTLDGKWSGRVVPIPGALEALAKLAATKKPKRIFVQSMGDLFHQDVAPELIIRVMQIITKHPQHTFLFLTKRPQVMKWVFDVIWREDAQDWPAGSWPLANCWAGVTAENQAMADERIPVLLSIPAAVRFVSVEPMLEEIVIKDSCMPCSFCKGRGYYLKGFADNYFTPCPKCQKSAREAGLNLQPHQYARPGNRLDWIICGAETGPGARYMDPQWARDLRDQCREAGVPFFFKKMSKGAETPNNLQVREFPK